MTPSSKSVVKVLLDRFGQTYTEQAGIKLADKPSPLYELLVLATLLSARISSDVAVAAPGSCSPPGTGHRSACRRLAGRTG
jgi:hypothetical protein